MLQVWLRLLVSCAILGAGVALLLTAALGSDGYSTMVSGLSIAVSLPVLAIGVAGYLAVDAGAGPAEAAAIALDPPIPFRWSYGIVQGGGALVGWACGAAVGPGTVLVIVLLGPLVNWLSDSVPVLRTSATSQR